MIAGLDRIHAGAVRIADEMASRASEIGVTIHALPNGARLIDAGVAAPGSHEAGRLFAEACMGGLGRVTVGPRALGGTTVMEARAAVSHPLVACMASQYAGWRIKAGKFVAMGSGPARAMAAVEPLFGRYEISVRADRTVLLLETSTLPGPEVADLIASKCGLPPPALTLVAASTGSPAGTTQIAARSVETALHKLMELDFDLGTVIAGAGSCPIAAGTSDPLRAIGRTNDAMLYGSEVSLWARADDEAIEAVLNRVPASSSRDYGTLFYDLFRKHGDFYKIDPMLFSPARVTFVNAPDGRIFSAGEVDEAMLLKSFSSSTRIL
jgi:methenyltetrahydromethanopterin cyclohydrolase